MKLSDTTIEKLEENWGPYFEVLAVKDGYALVGSKEEVGITEDQNSGDLEFFSFTIYKTDKFSGKKHGYIGRDLLKIERRDIDNKTFINAAKAAFKAI